MPTETDLLPTVEAVRGEQLSPALSKRLTCDFCGCQLTPHGDVLKMGDDAKRYRDAADTIEKLERQIQALKDELRDARAALPPAVPAKSGGLFS